MMLDICSSNGASEVMAAEVTDLVGYIWNEANGELNDVLSVPVEGIKLEQVEKAEAALLSIKLILDGTNKDGDVQNLTNEFYSAIPYKHKSALDTKRDIAKKQDLCQVYICCGGFLSVKFYVWKIVCVYIYMGDFEGEVFMNLTNQLPFVRILQSKYF